MGKAPPAFQFYAADFAEGTDDMTLTEVGGYIRLLCSQWAKGFVPGDNMTKLAGIMRCTPATAKSIWQAIAEKFDRGDDGRWRNARLEEERENQAKYRALQSQRGKASAAKRGSNVGSTPVATTVQPALQPKGQPEGNPKPEGNSSVFSLQSSKIQEPSDLTTSNPSGRTSSPLVMSPIRFAKLQETHAFVGSRLRVPFVLHDEFRTKGGSDEELQGWYAEVNAELESEGTRYGDVFDFLRPRFKSWIGSRAGDDEMRKFKEGA